MNAKGDAWLEGFVAHATDRGVPADQIPKLIKLSAIIRLQQDPDFSAAFDEKCAAAGLEKDAVLPLMMAALGGLGAWQGAKWLGKGIGALHRKLSPMAQMKYQQKLYDQAKGVQTTAKNRFAESFNPMLEQAKSMGLAGADKKPAVDGAAPATGRINPWLYP